MNTISRRNPISKVDIGVLSDVVFAVAVLFMSLLESIPENYSRLIAFLAVCVLVIRLLKLTGETINEYIKIND